MRVSSEGFVLQAPRMESQGRQIQTMRQLSSPSGEIHWTSPQGEAHRVVTPGPMEWLREKGLLILSAPDGQRVCWEMPEGRLEACEVQVMLTEPGPVIERIVGLGDVRFQRKEGPQSQLPQLIMSERAEFVWGSQELRLSAMSPKQVYLWNREANQAMSCSSLRMWKDPVTREWLQEGEGEVRIILATDQLRHVRALQEHQQESIDAAAL